MPPVLRSKSTLSLLSYQTFPPHLSTPSTTVPSPPTEESVITNYLMDPEPPQQAPNPWVWRCHLCHITYRLGCTRRCLECSHEFCTTLETAPPKPGSIKKKKRTRRRGGGPCKAEFDYAEWQKYGAWRRTIVLNDEPKQSGRVAATAAGNWGREVDATTEKGREEWTKKKERLFILGKHDCWQHCDYPSECRHTLYTAIVEGRAVQASPTVDVMEENHSDQFHEEDHALTSDICIDSNIVEADETGEDVDDGTLAIIATTTDQQMETDCCTDLDLSNLQAIEEDHDDLDPSMVKMLRGRQERRSQRKLARLTGLDSLSPLDVIDTVVSTVPEATTCRPLNISADRQQLASTPSAMGTTSADQDENDGPPFSSVGLRLPQVDEDGYISTPVGFERMSSCCPGQGYAADADDWESWSDSSGSSSSSSSALTYTDSMVEDDATSVGRMSSDDDEACPVSHYGIAPDDDDDDDASPIDSHDDLSTERDLIALIRMRNAFMRGDI